MRIRLVPVVGSRLGPAQRAPGSRPPVFPVAMAGGRHPFPFRTRKLSPPAPMVLRGGPRGRVGRRREAFEGRWFRPAPLRFFPPRTSPGGAGREGSRRPSGSRTDAGRVSARCPTSRRASAPPAGGAPASRGAGRGLPWCGPSIPGRALTVAVAGIGRLCYPRWLLASSVSVSLPQAGVRCGGCRASAAEPVHHALCRGKGED
jgi:hypothetical protein